MKMLKKKKSLSAEVSTANIDYIEEEVITLKI